MTQRYKLKISYDGTNYCGWQIQPNGPSIQAKLQEALLTLLKTPILVVGAGRTDAGVHAQGQMAHFDLPETIDPYRLHAGLNGLLPHDIRIRTIEPVLRAFHARFSAIGKEYHYHLWLERALDPCVRLYRHHIHTPLSLSLLAEATRFFLGTHDFTTFTNVGGTATSHVRTIKRIDLVPQEGGLRLEFEGDGFLYKMIRNITGLLLDIAKGKRTLNEIEALFSAKDRRAAGLAAPPKGLFLVHINYPEQLVEKISSDKEESVGTL